MRAQPEAKAKAPGHAMLSGITGPVPEETYTFATGGKDGYI